MRQPERAVMWVIVGRFAGGLFHRPSPRHRLASRSDDRPEDRLIGGVRDVLGKQLAVELNGDAAVGFFDRERGGRQKRREKASEGGKNQSSKQDRAMHR